VGLILDSTVLITGEREAVPLPELLTRIEAKFGSEELAVAAMTAAELVHGVWRAKDAKVRAWREEFVEEVFARIATHPFTLQTARILGRIDAHTRAKGITIPTADLSIGASALELGFSVLTANVRRYRMIPNLKVRRW